MNRDKLFIKPVHTIACIEYHICMKCDNGVSNTLVKCYDFNIAKHILESGVLECIS